MHSLLRASALAVLFALAPSAFAQDLAPHVYPNPVVDSRAVTVEVADAASATIEVVDILGRVVSAEAPLAAGTYLVRVRYTDGRTTEPTSLTVASPGRIELRLAEATVLKAGELAAPITSAPVPTAANQQGGCPSSGTRFGGFNHAALTGSLRLRPDLIPMSMRAQPQTGTNTVDFTTCFGAAQGVAFRYIAGGDLGNRPLRVLSPSVVGNTQASFTANYSADGNPAQALYGTFEVMLDNDGDGNTPTVPAVQVGFDADSDALRPREESPIASRGGGGYQLLVLDDDGVLVYETFASESTPLYVTPVGSATRVNLLRSIILSSVVDGFDVDGASAAPGDLKVALTFESGDGSSVNIHVGDGAPDTVGATVHITPTFTFSDPTTFSVSDIRTYATGVNRYGVRSLQFAGGANNSVLLKSGPGGMNDGQWGRPQGEDVEPHTFDVFNASQPSLFVGASGPVEDYGIQFGREPASLQETGSEVLVLNHTGGVFARGFSGVALDDDGDFYRGTARIRNQTDGVAENASVTFTNVGGTDTSVLVGSDLGGFTTYEFVYDADLDGDAEIRSDGTVGVPMVFSVSDVLVASSGAGDADPDDLGSRQDFAIAFLLQRGANTGAVYIYPDWTSTDANVNVRSYASEAHEGFFISDVLEIDQDDAPALRDLLRSFGATE